MSQCSAEKQECGWGCFIAVAILLVWCVFLGEITLAKCMTRIDKRLKLIEQHVVPEGYGLEDKEVGK